MFSFASVFAVVMISALATTVSAAPVFPSQLANLACNTARLKTVTGIEAASAAVGHIQAAGNSTVATAVTNAKTGLETSTAGVTTILDALFSGQSPPSDARDQVGDGFTQTLEALQSIASGGSATSKAAKKALGKLQSAINAGNDVIALCGSGNATATSAPSSSAAVVSASGVPIITIASSAPSAASTTSV